ncbi:MAG: S-methyl-5-thioribose-1-phosphate isomerase [Coriobacteriia bacterium]|nr:S-methyl-5-thioribose-1-phosphate isomerase [Coriobacteriia bacterium]MCL2136675.1 S-methyl-5-thioribose-1-phosphate isomerase [Coriobacteriia bacterium]
MTDRQKADLSRIPRSIWWDIDATNGRPGVFLLDQTRLPLVGDVLCCQKLEGVELAIKTLAVRGAPALGIAAAMAIAVWSENESTATTVDEWLYGVDTQAARISLARPTAVNLAWGAKRLKDYSHDQALKGKSLAELKEDIVSFASQMAVQDEAVNRAIGENGAPLLKKGSRVLTHCNAGSLATAFFGTVGGVIYTAYGQERLSHVWVDETRPLNQGGRLTAWELMVAGVPCTLISDSMAASVMQAGWVDMVLVGADRICANGDVANKIGTLMLAIAAHYYDIPFYVCAPLSTIDASLSEGSQIPIEQRDRRELAGFTATGTILADDETTSRALGMLTLAGPRNIKFAHGHEMSIYRKDEAYAFDAWFMNTPPDVPIYNPAFDVTSASLITGIITEAGVFPASEITKALA